VRNERLLVFLAAAALGASACRSSVAAPAAPSGASRSAALRLRPDRVYLYDLTLESHVAYGGDAELALALASSLRVQSGGDPAGALLALSFEEPRFADVPAAATAEYAALAAELHRGFVIETADGRVRGLRAIGQPSAFAANIFQTVAQAFALPASGPAPTWTAEAADASGRYVAEFARAAEPGRFTTRKLRYLEAEVRSSQLEQVALTLTPRIATSQGELRLAEGALSSFVYDEELETGLGEQGRAHARNHLALELRQTTPGTAGDLRAGTAPLETGPRRVGVAERRALDTTKIGDFTFDSAVARLRAIVRGKATLLASEKVRRQASPGENEERARLLGEHNQVFSALAAILRTQPAAVGRALSLVRGGSDIARSLIDAVGAADSEPAQAGLEALARDRRLSDELRSAAAFALTRVETPGAGTVTALVALADDPVVRLFALYGLGTVSRRLRDQGQREVAARAGVVLAERLRTQHDPLETVHLLRGIANSGFAGALPVVQPLLGHADDTVRGAAVEALRWMDDPAVDGLIAGRLRAEQRPFALRAALNAAKIRQPTPPLAEAVAAVATTAKDDHSRYAAIELMARWQPAQPSLREVLDRVARTDAVPAVREAARAAL
jgi:hypothetical protein